MVSGPYVVVSGIVGEFLLVIMEDAGVVCFGKLYVKMFVGRGGRFNVQAGPVVKS